MRILIAPDSFKDSLSAKDAAEAIARGIKHELPGADIRIIPMADGGEGTVSAMVEATKGSFRRCRVHDPLMREIDAEFGISGDGKTAIIEMAKASGLELIKPGERNPWLTTSFGTGELILAAMEEGCKKIIIGIGGSATNDGGLGMATALGIRFYDSEGMLIGPAAGQLGMLSRIDISDRDRRFGDIEIRAACDVTNPLTGPEGASYVFGPQKGADGEMVRKLDQNLQQLAVIIKRDLQIDVADIPGSGAAGGLGAGLIAFTNASLETGFDIVSNETRLEEHIQWADLVLTGEGKIDSQTRYGKTPAGVAALAKKNNKQVIAFAGTLGEGYEKLYQSGFDAIVSILDKPLSLVEALDQAPHLLEYATRSVIRLILAGKRITGEY